MIEAGDEEHYLFKQYKNSVKVRRSVMKLIHAELLTSLRQTMPLIDDHILYSLTDTTVLKLNTNEFSTKMLEYINQLISNDSNDDAITRRTRPT